MRIYWQTNLWFSLPRLDSQESLPHLLHLLRFPSPTLDCLPREMIRRMHPLFTGRLLFSLIDLHSKICDLIQAISCLEKGRRLEFCWIHLRMLLPAQSPIDVSASLARARFNFSPFGSDATASKIGPTAFHVPSISKLPKRLTNASIIKKYKIMNRNMNRNI